MLLLNGMNYIPFPVLLFGFFLTENESFKMKIMQPQGREGRGASADPFIVVESEKELPMTFFFHGSTDHLVKLHISNQFIMLSQICFCFPSSLT